jgi:hypothetical protein
MVGNAPKKFEENLAGFFNGPQVSLRRLPPIRLVIASKKSHNPNK